MFVAREKDGWSIAVVKEMVVMVILRHTLLHECLPCNVVKDNGCHTINEVIFD